MPALDEWSPLPMTEVPQTKPAPYRAPLAFVEDFLNAVTGTGKSQAVTLCAFTMAMTGAPLINEGWNALEVPALVHRQGPVESGPTEHSEAPARSEGAEHSALSELRERTSLNVTQLAELFGVARATIYSWQGDTSPRGDRENHLLEALAFVRSASEQFPVPSALKQWLMTPVAADAETPLQLMAQRRWRPLRGLLVRARTPSTFLNRPEPLSGHVQPLSAEQLRRAAAQLSPPSAREDLEELGLDKRQEPLDAE